MFFDMNGLSRYSAMVIYYYIHIGGYKMHCVLNAKNDIFAMCLIIEPAVAPLNKEFFFLNY